MVSASMVSRRTNGMELSCQQDADVVALDVVGDEIGLAVVVHVQGFDAPSAFARAKGRTSGALEPATAVAKQNDHAMLGAERQIDPAIAIQVHGHDAIGAIAELKR